MIGLTDLMFKFITESYFGPGRLVNALYRLVHVEYSSFSKLLFSEFLCFNCSFSSELSIFQISVFELSVSNNRDTFLQSVGSK